MQTELYNALGIKDSFTILTKNTVWKKKVRVLIQFYLCYLDFGIG